ncbi:MAG: hypothetical protein ACRD4H_13415, partial [Candidatus Acidiferrales bacterium]
KLKTAQTLQEEDYYELTDEGRHLAHASAAPRIPRSRAETMVTDFMTRVRIINADDQYAYRVSTVILFGSYVSDRDTLGDIDLATEYAPRVSDVEALERIEKERRDLAHRNGRRLEFIESLDWPRREIDLFLKNRQRGLSVHKMDELIQMAKQRPLVYKILLGDEKRIADLLSTSS